MCNCDCGHLSAAEAGNGSSVQNHGTPASRYVTLREMKAMTGRSASVRQLFEDNCTDSRVDRMLLRTGKVCSQGSVNISHLTLCGFVSAVILRLCLSVCLSQWVGVVMGCVCLSVCLSGWV